ncbi:MAG: polyprenol monophosphomannose synthase [Coriobacteriia bacterium]|nr:polyprenol monophosphomannose synthase [Coriobacteriia bacterium]
MRTVVVVPTYNEAGNIQRLAELLLALEPFVDVLIVDDNSPDGTGRLGDEIAAGNDRFHMLHRTEKRGYSASSKEGMQWALSHGYEAVATMDGDLSHDPDVLPRLMAAVEAGADLAIGSRYTPGGEIQVDWGPFRRAVSQAGSAYARMMVGTPTRDCTSGYRCYNAAMLRTIPIMAIQSEGYSFLIELLAGLRDRNATIVEVPITYVDRRHGASKISKSIIFEALGRTTSVGLARVTGKRRREAGSVGPS